MKIKPFRGLRPVREKASLVASRPYDVLSSDEAREEAKGNPFSFLRVVKPEITLPSGTDDHSPVVYNAGKENFEKLVSDGIFFQDEDECLYIYELTMNGRSQNGIVSCASVDEYLQGRIKRHELTRPDKELDRKNHVRTTMINAEPVFLAYPASKDVDRLVESIKRGVPEYAFVSDDEIQHRFWVVADQGVVRKLVAEFEKIPATYVADGHHRTAAAARVGDDLKKENKDHTGSEAYNYFLAVHFPDDQLAIMDYNRLVKDLNGLDSSSFLRALGKAFLVNEEGEHGVKPSRLHEFSLYLEGKWYSITAREGTYDDTDPIGVLDVTILSTHVLGPILGIHDLRTDKRIDFVGGIRGLGELERRVDSGEMRLGIALYPVSMKQLIAIADSGEIMPPKTTWFEPKLRSGLVVHRLAD